MGKGSGDILNGNIWKGILSFALPVALTGMLQQLFNAADVAVVGRFVSANAMAAVGSNSAIIGLIVNLFIGVSIGANVVIARYTGQGDDKKVSEAVHTAIVLAVICGCIIAVVGFFIAKPMTVLLGVPGTIAPMAIRYMRIYFAGMPVIMLYNFETAIFRSQGDTKTPLICLATSGVVNVGLNLFFVLVCGMSVEGVGIATVLANLLSSAMLFRFLMKAEGVVKVDPRKLRITKCHLIRILKIGVPSGLQGTVFSISNLVVQSAVNSLGEVVIAATVASFNVEVFAFFILNAFGQAVVTYIGQNYGAGNYHRCEEVVRKAMILNIATTMSVCGLVIVFGRPLLGIFNGDPKVIEFGLIRLMTFLPFNWVNCILETFSGALKGYGRSVYPTIASFVGVCGTRILWVYTVFQTSPTLVTLMRIYPISWAVASLILMVMYFAIKRQMFKRPLDAML